jgi:hypothetical protein
MSNDDEHDSGSSKSESRIFFLEMCLWIVFGRVRTEFAESPFALRCIVDFVLRSLEVKCSGAVLAAGATSRPKPNMSLSDP